MKVPETQALWLAGTSMPRYFLGADSDRFFVEGRGVRIRDAGGRWYLDARSSLWNLSLGYDHPRVLDAIRRQLDTLTFVQTIRHDRPSAIAVEYADRLADALPPHLTRIRFGNTGAQAVEGAVLLSRYVRIMTGAPERTAVVALAQGWHGTGGLAAALTGEEGVHALLGPLVPDVYHAEPPYCARCPFDLRYPDCAIACARAIGELVERLDPARVTAVVVEPLLGTRAIEGPEGYLREVAAVCRAHGLHLIVDEISTGLGRCGTMTASEQAGVEPDLVAFGKGMTSGYVPASAIAVAESLYQAVADVDPFSVFPHSSTTDGHPLAMAAGIAVLDALEQEGILERVRERGAQLRASLDLLRDRHALVFDVRGRGLMLGIELAGPGGEPLGAPFLESLRVSCERRGVLFNYTGNCLMVVPPLVVTESDCEEIVAVLDSTLTDLETEVEALGIDLGAGRAWSFGRPTLTTSS